jgi:hypothetical protein
MIAKRFASIGVAVALLIACAMQAKGADTITVVSGTYGANCRAPTGNKTSFLAKACNGKTTCSYKVEVTILGDPAYGCAKTYVAQWRCGSSTALHSASAPAEAGYGSVVTLTCAAASAGKVMIDAPPGGFKPCARNSGGSGGTWPCTGPGGTEVYLVLNRKLPSAPAQMFFTRDMAYSTAGSVTAALSGAGMDYHAGAPAALCMGNAPHTYWVGFIDAAGRAYPDQGQFTITGCP